MPKLKQLGQVKSIKGHHTLLDTIIAELDKANIIFFFWSDFQAHSVLKAARSHSGCKGNIVCGRGKARNLQVRYCTCPPVGKLAILTPFLWIGLEVIALSFLGLCPLLSHVHTC